MAKAADYKKKIVEDIGKLISQYPITGVVNMENLPAPQLQAMRAELRGKVSLYMTKKRLMKLALKNASEKKGLEELENYLEGMPALIFTKDSPFKLSKILRKSKTAAPAKAGQTAPDDIVVPKGPTPFAPGPIISELSSAGLKVGVEGGKVAVKEDAVVAKKGDKITAKVAEILTRLDIKPMEVGLDLVAAYENGLIYKKDILNVDEKEYISNINLAAVQCFNLAFNITYVTKDNINLMISKAFNDAKSLGVSQEILDSGIIEELLSNAERSMISLRNIANIEVIERLKKESPKGAIEELKEEKPLEKEKFQEIPKELKKEIESKEEIEIAKESKVEVKEEKVPLDLGVKESKQDKEPGKKLAEKEAKAKERAKKQIKEEVKVKPAKEVKQEEPEIEAKEPEIEEDIYEKETREELLAEGEISPMEEGFMQGYEEAGETEKEEEKLEIDIDEKVVEMVEKTKKFMAGKEETAEDIIEEIEKEDLKEKFETEEEKEELQIEYELRKKKEEKERKEVEKLAKELLRKGTLRKK